MLRLGDPVFGYDRGHERKSSLAVLATILPVSRPANVASSKDAVRIGQIRTGEDSSGTSMAAEVRANMRRVALHRAVRAAIVPPATFALSLLVIRDVQVATFALFGCFALLVLADFGGRRRPRAAAYATATVVGAALVALGTVVSPSLVAGAVLMFVIAFTLATAGAFGGYLAAAQGALLLAFVLAVSIPAGTAAVPTRIAGWALAGVVSTLAGVFFWPTFEQQQFRSRAAKACAAIADLVDSALRTRNTDGTPYLQQARAAIEAIRAGYGAHALRPAGPTRRDQAYVELVTELDQIIALVAKPVRDGGVDVTRPCTDEGDVLAAEVVDCVRGAGSVLTGGPGPNVGALVTARRAHRAALDRWATEQLAAGRSADEILDGLDVDHTLRIVSFVTISLSANASAATGGRPEDDAAVPTALQVEEVQGGAARVAARLRAHLDPSSTVLHQSIRTAVGLTLSVVLARTLGLSHAFWVVLGTLSVLRSNALGTGRSTVQALAGSVIGFVLGGLFSVAAGTNTIVEWLGLPIAVFFASYAASAIGFAAGQAGFTILVIIVFNLISPAGWQVGLARIEDVALGTAISVVVGFLLWPRGARRDFLRATAGLYRAMGTYLGRAFGGVLDTDPSVDAGVARAATVRARDRAGEAFGTFLTERGAKPLDTHTAAELVGAGSLALLAGDALTVVADEGYRAGACSDRADAVDTAVQAVLLQIGVLAGELERGADGALPIASVSSAALRDAELGGLRRAQAGTIEVSNAMAVVIASEWVENLARLLTDLETRVDESARAMQVRWWR